MEQSAQNMFDFQNMCFVCGEKLDRKHKKVSTVPNDTTSKDRFINLCERNGDENSQKVLERIGSVHSLVGVRAAYHKLCYDRLAQILYPAKSKKISKDYEAALQNVFEFIEESDKHHYTLHDFKEIMKDQFPTHNVLYTALKKRFGKEIQIETARGKDANIFFKKAGIAEICADWHYDQNNISNGAKKTILKVAADILKKEIMTHKYENKAYPPASQFLHKVSDDVPSLLSNFLNDLMYNEENHENENLVKRDAIAHSIITCLRPITFISSLQLAVGTYIYRKTGSKLIVQLLSKLGFSASYNRVQLYEASTIMDPSKFSVSDAFVQFVFDNTDHNVNTLDGRETFHCLGGIAVYTPGCNVSYTGNTKKLGKMPSASTLAKQKQIKTIPFSPRMQGGLRDIKYKSTHSLDLPTQSLIPQHFGAYLWAKFFRISQLPSWKGFMEIISNEGDFSVSHVNCLPFINEPPSNPTTLHTSLHYALQETKNLAQATCFVTYDQPLYLKARTIVAQLEISNPKFRNVVIRLGGFHMLMSYLGAIGYTMAGSGLEDLWSVMYAAQSVKKMISGHAFARALRAHILTFTSLGIIICEKITDEMEDMKNEGTDAKERHLNYEKMKEKMIRLFTNWPNNAPQLGELDCNDSVIKLSEEFTKYLTKIAEASPTAKLWTQYIQAVSIALQFVEAERLGNWSLHLQSVRSMLPLFHASGHFAYAKSAQIYLQDMVDLEFTMDPIEYSKFATEGYFTIRRSNKAWSGVWSDMTIEQTLNRFFGTDLKHGRGVTPSVVARYLLGMPAAFDVMNNLEEVLNISSKSSEQHVDLSASRIQRDDTDISKLLIWLGEHRPFDQRSCLLSLSTGFIGNPEINCHKAFEFGNKGMMTMINKNAEFSLTKLYKVQNLTQAKSIHISEKFSSIDPLMLFQRISMIIQGDQVKMREAFKYELSPYPLSLFD